MNRLDALLLTGSSLVLPGASIERLTSAYPPHAAEPMLRQARASLSTSASSLLASSLKLFEPLFDPSSGFINAGSKAAPYRDVRTTAWYALGLLARDGGGGTDRMNAAKALNAVGSTQMTTGANYGLWPSYQGQSSGYDTNMREFVGSAFIIAVEVYGSKLGTQLTGALLSQAQAAGYGAYAHNPPPSSYTNIALLYCLIVNYSGQQYIAQGQSSGGQALVSSATTVLETIYNAWTSGHTLCEFDSPTYDGTDLLALRTVIELSNDSTLSTIAGYLESALWSEITGRYNPVLRNSCGPYDRAYGMDQNRYVSGIGLAIWLATSQTYAPIPSTLSSATYHAADLAIAFPLLSVGVACPSQYLPYFESWQYGTGGSRTIVSALPSAPGQAANTSRTAYSYLTEHYILGGETNKPVAAIESYSTTQSNGQDHVGTAHWGTANELSWLRIYPFGPVNVSVEKNVMTVTLPTGAQREPGAFQFLIYSAQGVVDLKPSTGSTTWTIGDMSIAISGTIPTALSRSTSFLPNDGWSEQPGSTIAYVLGGAGTGPGASMQLTFTLRS